MRSSAIVSLASLFMLAVLSMPLFAHAALPLGFEVETLAAGMNQPTAMTFTADGRIFVAEKAGAVRVIKNGALLATPLIALTDVNAYGDRGLIGLAVDPNFAANGYLYLLYTYENTPGTNFAGLKTGRLVRVTVVGDTADESTKTVILGTTGGTLATPSCENYAVTDDCIPSDSPSHSTGGLRFGPDGALYVTLGDGAHFDYVDTRAHRAQNLDSLGGKVLRIHADGTGYTTNPFYNGSLTANRSKVYAYGVRNAYRFNFRPSNGALYLGDVGWNTWEEVNKVVSGGNYGWPCREGAGTNGYNCDVTPRVDPLYTYAHDAGGAGAVAAGAFPTAYPAEYSSSYFFGDYAQNWIKRIVVDANDTFVSVEDFMSASDDTNGPVAIDRGPDGNLYFISIYTGELKRILYTTGNRQPIAQISATPSNGLAPLTVNFSAAGSSDPDGNPLTFNWNFGDGATATGTTAQLTYTANGTYTAVLTVTDGQGGGLSTKSVSIAVGNRAPTAVIASPASGGLYEVGEVIQLSGSGTDPEDGTITATAQLNWSVILHHNTHTHVYETLTGSNPTFSAPDHDGATDIYTEVRLTVTDSGGLTNTKSINLYRNNNNSAGGNLIKNPSLENAVVGAPDSPADWHRGAWGTMNYEFRYPVAGQEGANAAEVQVVTYTSGDAKWMHDVVSVVGGTLYTFTGYYKSTAAAELLVQHGAPGGTYTYETLNWNVPPAAAWTQLSYTFTAPANAITASVALALARVGTVTIDNFSIYQGTTPPPPSDTTPPTVTLTAPSAGVQSGTEVVVSATAADNVAVAEVHFYLDGAEVHSDGVAPYSFLWDTTAVADGAHTLYAVAHDSSENPATSATVNVTVQNQAPPPSQNLIANPSVETLSATPTLPQDWVTRKQGTHTAAFTYPVAGQDGTRAMQVRITQYRSGNSGWSFKNVPVTPGVSYTYSHYYKSTAISRTVALYTLANGTVSTVTLTTSVPASTPWAQLNYTLVPPANAVSVTVEHQLRRNGTLTTDNYSLLSPSAPPPPPPPPTPTNLILNGTFETVNGADPAHWTRAGYGNNTLLYSYPVVGHDGGKAVEVQLSNYVDGDGKWIPEAVPMQYGKEYTFSAWYKGTTITDVIGRYNLTNGNDHHFGVIKELPPTTTWTYFTAKFTPPNTAVSFIPLHLMSTNGTFAIDDVSLTITGNATSTNDLTPPLVAITTPSANATVSGTVVVTASSTDNIAVTGIMFAVDGTPVTGLIAAAPYTYSWNTTGWPDGVHVLKATTHDAAGNNDFTTITVTVDNTGSPPPPPPPATNLILNPSLENETAGLPTDWFQGKWGTHNAVFTYPVAGYTSTRAASVSMTSYSSGDAKWYFAPRTVTAGTTYTYAHYYQSTAPTTVTVQYTRADGTNLYDDLAYLSAAGEWTQFSRSLVIPTGVTSMTIFHHLSAVGSLTVDTYSLE